MKRYWVINVLAVVLSLLSTGAALAVTNGQPDGDDHPYVGLVLFDSAPGTPGWRCSGSLIASDVVLTAGHCTDGADGAQVWFDAGPIQQDQNYTSGSSCYVGGPYTDYPCSGGVRGTPHTNPKYMSIENHYGGKGLPSFSYRDVGIVVLDEPIPMDRYAKLPAPGRIDTLKNKTPIDFVGYGVQYQAQVPGNELNELPEQPPPYYRWAGPRVRLYAPSELVSGRFVHSAEFMRLALNPGGGSGGTCFGDSGGPDLLGDTDIILAVNSYVTNVNCAGVGYSSRVDIPQVLDWINSFLPDPN